MKTDIYTKTILTIIAICLLYIAGRNMVVPAYADRKEIIDVNIAKVDGGYLGRTPFFPKLEVNYEEECWIRRQGNQSNSWLNCYFYRDLFQELVGDNRVAAHNNCSVGMVPGLPSIRHLLM